MDDRTAATPPDDAVRLAYADGRLSAQRRAVAETVLDLDGAFTIADLAHAVRARLAGVAMATVYRAVSAMEVAGFLAPVGSNEGATLYARCDTGGHHHHAICEACGAIECLDCPLPSVHFDTSVTGFEVTRHEFRLYGLCDACATGAATPGSATGSSAEGGAA